ncbi:MAG: hypothetical protein C4582_00400 [Desulfobacteraceae bacterium]|nr:MAG: hypothetical protein C4582_00400 [Desulfobacteraceae bacterium]
MKKRFLAALVLTLCFTVVLLTSSNPVPAAEKVYEWKFVCDYPPSDLQMAEAIPAFAKWVEKASNGRLKFKLYSAGQLVPPDQSFDNVRAGTFQLLQTYAPYHAGKIPVSNVAACLPLGPRDINDYRKLMMNYGMFDLLFNAYGKFGVHLLAQTPYSGLNVMSKKPLRKLEDFKGLKMRTSGLQAKLWNAAGAGTIYIPGGELYLALQTGVVDAATWSNPAIEGMKFGEVIKYIVYGYPFPPGSSTSFGVGTLLANEAAFKALPDDLKEILVRCAQQYGEYTYQVYTAFDNYLNYGGGAKKYGIEIIQLTEEDTKKLRDIAIKEVWPEVESKDELSKKYVQAVTQLLKDEGVIK